MKILKSMPYRLSLLLVALILTFTVFGGSITYASAFSLSEGLESSNVLDDLQSSNTNGKPFDITNYPYDESREIQLIHFVEYCYSYRVNKRDHYGLYVYIYNPKGLELSTTARSNKIQMATAYDKEGNSCEYVKFNLKFCSKSEGANYNNLFYKFRVVDKEINGTTFDQRVNSNQRRYDVSGIELTTKGDMNATEYFVGGTYKFTGYAKGYGPDKEAESNLDCTIEYLETLTLEVHHSNFRTNASSLGKNHYNEVNTAYFAVPERVFEEYGKLQKIHAEWWEYKTKMAAITSNRDFYEQMLLYTGKDVGEYDGSVPIFLYSGYRGQSGAGYANHFYEWVYNVDMSDHGGLLVQSHLYDNMSTILPYAFYSPSVGVDSVFGFLYSKPPAGSVEGNVVQEWIYNYKNDLGNGYIDCNGREISKDLFEDTVDEGRKMGYNNVNIDLEDTFDLNSYDSNHSWWDKLWDYGFSWPSTDGDYKDVAPIYELKASDLTGDDTEISKNLLVNKNNVGELKNFFNSETAKGNRVVLFRFANTDYYSAPAFRSGYSGSIDKTDTYVAQQTVFLDFDIISLTFNKEGTYTVIPVVSSPTDIINGFDPPATGGISWLRLLLAILLLVLLVVLLIPFFPTIFNAIIWFVTLPFKLVANIIKKDRKTKKASKKQSVDEERYKKVMRSDFPKDFADEDPFTAALLDEQDKKG